ncbi:hypothetical protein yc1106_04187 [Curvularia clavata]|uniref:SET domain-containing protein n=1 Tax=Curvularia clavata TaxID=95742 RepID=A0A9Q9DQZ5_CURCL|nr:hypothetical protein yc1106_04187 [Curvularia clavata]
MSDEQQTSVATPAPYYVAKSNVCVNSKGESVGNGLFANKRFGAGEEIARFKRPLKARQQEQDYMYQKVQRLANALRARGSDIAARLAKRKRGIVDTNMSARRKHGLISDKDWELLCGLPSHIDDFKRNGTYQNIEMMAMGAGQFALSQNIFDRDFVAAMYGRVMSNALTLITPTLDPLGIIVDPTLCQMNHSCDPNAYIMMDGPLVSIRTLRPIRKDKEIFISYIDTTHPYQKRQDELQARWFFTCRCAKCQDKATHQEDNWLVSAAPDYVVSKEEMQTLTSSQEQMFTLYEQAQAMGNAEAVVPVLKGCLKACHESNKWPLYRQPYASIRDELILYPVPFHPVRVIQTWQMAMLAAYLASDEEGVGAPGVNMGLIAMMLVKQVLDVAPLSHGQDNAFTRSVMEKAREMMEELKRSVGNPDKDIMNRELEAQRDRLMDMGDWVQDGKTSDVKVVEKAFSTLNYFNCTSRLSSHSSLTRFSISTTILNITILFSHTNHLNTRASPSTTTSTMAPKAAADKGEKMFSADVVAAVLYCTGTTSLSMKNYEMMSSLDGKKSAYGFQHDFRLVLAKAKELKARVEGGEDFKPVPSSRRDTAKKGKRAMSGSDVDETPSKKKTKSKEEVKPVPAPKLVPSPSKGILSAQGILESVPADADAFMKGEEQWEEEYA